MKPRLSWHRTPAGRIACFLGNIKPAIPVLLGVAVALAYGTYIESSQSADKAKEVVYGSWWFIALMAWVTLALVFAVVVRYPWNRRHTGFIIVHAGLVTLIFGGFISLFGRIEGQVMLQEGMASSELEMPGRQLELWQIPGTAPQLMAVTDLGRHPKSREIGEFGIPGVSIRIVDAWANSVSRTTVLNDAARELEAVEISTDPNATEGTWIAESNTDNPQARFAGVQLRVMRADSNWQPPAPKPADEIKDQPNVDGQPSEEDTQSSRATLTFADGSSIEISQVGQVINDQWRVASIDFFEHATVGSNGLVENPGSAENPAVQVVLENTEDGSKERHITFSKFPDMKMARLLIGSTTSGAALDFQYVAGSTDPHANLDLTTNRLVFQNNGGEFSATWVKEDGSVQEFDLSGEPPFEIDLDGRNLYVLNHFDKARQGEVFDEAPQRDQNRPVLVVEIDEGYGTQTIQVPWKGRASFIPEGDIRPSFLAYGPTKHPLPFNLQLVDFRKNDYPGSTMAMAYESDVLWQPVHVHTDGDDHAALPDPEKIKIWMNHPLKYDGWKVYQSGFVGDDISIFSVMKDPGLGITYTGCILLCCGLLVMFYSRRYSHGHPGVPHFIPSAKANAVAKVNESEGSSMKSDSNNRSTDFDRRGSKEGVAA